MKVFVLNCGSSSVKFQLIDSKNEHLIAKGIVERVGAKDAIVKYQPAGKPDIKEIKEIENHTIAIDQAISLLLDPVHGVLKNKSEIEAVGHRIVHGGEEFSDSVLLSDHVIQKVKDCIKFAPLHNPANLKGIEAISALLPGISQVGVFDTAFHQKMPPISFLYALPYADYREHRIRRYGFHGTSHKYVAERAAMFVEKPMKSLKIITCHLGNGASITAISHGISIDTSMGFTPLEGLIMGTRCGDTDPAIIPYLMELRKLSTKEIDDYLNKKSGMLGITEISNDMREIEDKAMAGDERCKLALDMYCHRILKYIGGYTAILGGLDILVFTGGVGENSDIVRAELCSKLHYLGIEIDPIENKIRKSIERRISIGDTDVLIIPTNEELAIARDTQMIVGKK